MKNQNKKIGFLKAMIFAVVGFLFCAPLSVAFAGFIAVGVMVLPYISLPAGILGEGTPAEDEKEKSFIKKAQDACMEVINKALDKFKADNKLEDFTTLKSLIEKLSSKEELEVVKKSLNEYGLKVKSLEEQPAKAVENKSLYKALLDAFTEKKSAIDEAIAGNQKAAIRIEVKAVGTISVASSIGSGATQVTITEDTGITSKIRKRELTYLANVSVGSIGTNRALWIEETDEEGTPIMLAEGATKTQLDVQYVEQTMQVKKIAVYGKVTTELMADIPQLISYIQNNLMRRMDIVLEGQYFTGSGAGDNLKGVKTYATAFSAGSLAATIESANEYDVLQAIALQVQIAFGMANVCFVHPESLAKMKLLKDVQGQYIYPRWASADGLMVEGMKVIATTAITADEFIAGDFSVVNVLVREDMGIQIGLDGNDFIQNKKTMLLEKRVVQFVSANDTGVLVKGDFTTAKAALETP